MKRLAELLLEGCFLKHIPRSGYQFLGAGKESVAEHVYCTVFIAYVMSYLEPDADARKLMAMCLVHDLPEARTGDLNYVQKEYVTANEKKALSDALRDIPFEDDVKSLIDEFNKGESLEARLARDADQLSLVADLQALDNIGFRSPQTWLPHVMERLQTDVGKRLAKALDQLPADGWWRKLFY